MRLVVEQQLRSVQGKVIKALGCECEKKRSDCIKAKASTYPLYSRVSHDIQPPALL